MNFYNLVICDRKVTLEYICPPIPVRDFDWGAYLTEDPESGYHGHGSTKEDAIHEITEYLEEQ